MRVALFIASLACLTTAAAPAAPQETQDQFMTRCTQAVTETAAMESWANGQCAEKWIAATRSNPMVDALLSLFVAGTPAARDPADVQARASVVRWRSPSDGELAGLGVQTVQDPRLRIVFNWSEMGQAVPYDPVASLLVRGVEVDPIGCYGVGAGEFNSVWRVHAPGHAPFALSLYRREAPTASALAHLTASADLDRSIPTLGDLKAAEPDQHWAQVCD